ncbi:MAG: Na+:solute symporter [Saprospiraceae bacterium]|nr:Na+:solute symporter [Saprospiraceae bacterium]
MKLTSFDWIIIVLFMVVTLGIAIWSAKKSGKSAKEFFLSGNNMPWWMLGVSMVATTFSADTPNLVTDIVRGDGISGNWVWWAFLLTGMLTVFIYARLWRRAGILTDLEFYEMRYSGKEASFLRGFRAIYLGVFFNVMIMASVMLAGIKIGSIMLGLSAVQTVALVSLVTVFYSAVGGLRGVILTDVFQFVISMVGMIVAAIYILQMPEIGGLNALVTHEAVVDKLDFVPDFTDINLIIPLFIVPIAVQWWSTWYPGAEPGGGGYIAQRMLSAKSEKDAVKATLLFNVAHYALRPWPWLLIALASLVIFPDLESIATAFPGVDRDIVKNDLAFPAMLTLLPSGLVGLILAALIAALMSTISTHLNWGSSYVVNDFYGRFINKEASEKSKVFLGRLSTFILMVLAAVFALYLQNAKQAFDLLLQIGAGTGLLFILRWFWWRINALSEIVAMVVSFIIAFYFEFPKLLQWINGPEYVPSDIMSTTFGAGLESYEKMIIGVIITTTAWMIAAYTTKQTKMETLTAFYTKIQPKGSGWQIVQDNLSTEQKDIIAKNDDPGLTDQILMMLMGCGMVYCALFGFGWLLLGSTFAGMAALVIGSLLGYGLFKKAF